MLSPNVAADQGPFDKCPIYNRIQHATLGCVVQIRQETEPDSHSLSIP